MNDQLKNMIIGVFVISACLIVIFLLLFLHPSSGDEGQILHVRFSDIDKVNVGTRVTFAGRPVGEVTDIQEIEEGREGLHDANGDIYIYELTLAIDTGTEVYQSDVITLRTSGLLGERSVAIIPKAIPEGQSPRLIQKNEILYSVASGSVEQTMKEFKEVADKFDVALDNINQTINEIREEHLWEKLGKTAQNMSDITTALNRPEELKNIIKQTEAFTSVIADRIPQTWDKLDRVLHNADECSGKAQNIMTYISEGQGSLGKLLISNDLYLEIKALMAKANTVANDVNHYGLLFHLDKGWQRLRARRLNLLQKLCSPQQFRNFFNDEVDQISTSLSRVSMVLDQITGYCQVEDPEFNKVFAELLRRVLSMEESLQMYNQQLLDCEASRTELLPGGNLNCP